MAPANGQTASEMGSVAEKVMLTTKRPGMPVKPERSRSERIEEVNAFLKRALSRQQAGDSSAGQRGHSCLHLG
jgi:hypothetical protein